MTVYPSLYHVGVAVLFHHLVSSRLISDEENKLYLSHG